MKEHRDKLLGNQYSSQSKMQFIVLIISICGMFILQEIIRPGSVTVGQFMNISRQASALGIVVIGQAIVILAGGIDLSVGSIVTLTNVFAVSLMQGQNENILAAITVCLILGAICGAINAIGVIFLKIAPFIMTLCTMSVVQGVYLVYTKGSPSGNVSPMLKTVGNGLLFGVIPYPTIIWISLLVIFGVLLKYTSFGRKLYAVGSNYKAANLCGINANRVKFATYILSSLLAVIAGLIASGYIGTTSLTLGNDYINNSLAAVLIGGNAIGGGKGGVLGGGLGAFFMMLLFAILTMFSISHVGKLIIQGIIIFTVVASQNFFYMGGNRT